MIGLKRHTVQVVDHHPGWCNLAAKACQQLRAVCGNLLADVQHVGSTAVPNLPAKPILDLAAAVATLDVISELIEKVTAFGYIYRGDGKNLGGHLFVWESEPSVRTIHLHVVGLDDLQWSNYIRFRDILRNDSGVRKRYAGLKRKLWDTFTNDRKSYTDSKHNFIQGVLNTKASGMVSS